MYPTNSVTHILSKTSSSLIILTSMYNLEIYSITNHKVTYYCDPYVHTNLLFPEGTPAFHKKFIIVAMFFYFLQIFYYSTVAIKYKFMKL